MEQQIKPTGRPTTGSGLDVLRSELANERTLLAYFRTTLALFIVAGSAIKFFDSRLVQLIGWGTAVFGAVTLLWGLLSYRRTKRLIRSHRQHDTAQERSDS